MAETWPPRRVGDQLVLDVGPVAHGGHCVARADGQVVFVRHTLPGERVAAVVTGVGGGGRFLRADAVAVITASGERVTPPCPYAVPGGCGGCDWQHATPAAQRRLKAQVVAEQLARLARVEVAATVETLAGDQTGLGWRTRLRYSVDAQGRAGLLRHRSHDVVPVETCRLAHPLVEGTGVTRRRWPGRSSVEVVASVGSGETVVLPRPSADPAPRVTESAAHRQWQVSGTGFWQVHPAAADALVAAVREVLQPDAGEHLLDLYSGVGLFGGALAPDLGAGGRVDAVEADAVAVADARRNLADLATVVCHEDRVDRWLARGTVRRCDLVVLDPPRSGAGRDVVAQVARRRPRAVAYVACDPAALARDVATFSDKGYRLARLRAFDLFPMTHHVECVALLVADR